VLTKQDLGNTPVLDTPGKVLSREPGSISIGVPWDIDTSKATKGAFEPLCIAAVDAHGRFAALVCRAALRGVEVDELQLIAPKAAVPVLRGVPKTQPGSALPGHGELLARLDANGAPFEIEANLTSVPGAKRHALRQVSSGRPSGKRRVEILSQ
jgi:hypothetical protein